MEMVIMYMIKIKLICECIWTCFWVLVLSVMVLKGNFFFLIFLIYFLNVVIVSCLDLLKQDRTVKSKQSLLPNFWHTMFTIWACLD